MLLEKQTANCSVLVGQIRQMPTLQ